jgi:hypothetical protein
MKKLILATVLVIGTASIASTNFDYTQSSVAPTYNQENYNLPTQTVSANQTLKGSVVTVPAGQNLSAVVTTPISSENIEVGQSVSLALGSDFYYNGNLIAPAGSSVTGTAIEVSKAKHGSLNGKLLLRFTQITTPYGIQIPISAVIKTTDNTGVLVGGTKMDIAKNYGKDAAIGAGAGALAGVIISPLAGGSIGKGTALATAVGAGGGVVKSIWDKGNDVEIPANSAIQLVLTQPITVNPAIYNNY